MTAFQRQVDDAQVRHIYLRYGALVRRCADRVFRDGSTCDDVLTDVMIKVMTSGQSLFQLQSEAQKRKWLVSTTLRVCWDDKLRKKRESQRIEQLQAVHAESFRSGVEDRVWLEALLSQLDMEERILAVLFFEEEYTKAEIHQLMGRSRPYIDKKLAKIQHVQEALARTEKGEGS